MLTPVADGAAIVACNSCRHSADAQEDAAGVRGGVRMIAALRAIKAGQADYDGVAVQEMPCLFACKDFCTVHLRAPGKVGYILGRFAPTEDAARAILDYARAYAASDWGQVRFCEWPEGVKGHFITRMPPAGFVIE